MVLFFERVVNGAIEGERVVEGEGGERVVESEGGIDIGGHWSDQEENWAVFMC